MKTMNKMRWFTIISMGVGLLIGAVTLRYYPDRWNADSLYLLSIFIFSVSIGMGAMVDYFDDEILSKLHQAHYIHSGILNDCTYLSKERHYMDLDLTSDIIGKMLGNLRTLDEDERNDAWGLLEQKDINSCYYINKCPYSSNDCTKEKQKNCEVLKNE